MGNEKYPFMTITPWSIPTQSVITCYSPIYKSNRIVQSFTRDYYLYEVELLVLDSDTWNHVKYVETDELRFFLK